MLREKEVERAKKKKEEYSLGGNLTLNSVSITLVSAVSQRVWRV